MRRSKLLASLTSAVMSPIGRLAVAAGSVLSFVGVAGATPTPITITAPTGFDPVAVATGVFTAAGPWIVLTISAGLALRYGGTLVALVGRKGSHVGQRA